MNVIRATRPITRRRRALLAAAAALAGLTTAAPARAVPAHAQSQDTTITVTADFSADAYVEAQSPIGVQLSRLPAAAEGRIAIMVGRRDLTALFESRATGDAGVTGGAGVAGDTRVAHLTFRGRGFSLPAGEHELVVFIVSADGWRELGRFPLRVLTRLGFQQAAFAPALSLSSTGQLAEGHTGTAPAPERVRFQDVGGTGGVRSTHVRGAWTAQSQLNVIGVGNRREALRFGERGARAPKLDLADYLIRVERPGASLSVGHVSFGSSRHLINGFGSRGVALSLARGAASVGLAAMNGSSTVGWDNITGLDRSSHRMTAASLGLELLPARPGGVRVDVALLDGSVLPVTGFSAGGVVDAETSTGASMSFAASTPAQRVRIAGGYTASRFRNGADNELLGEGDVVALPSRRRAARHGELGVELLRSTQLLRTIRAALSAAARHERIEPLYRSVGAYAQADVEQNAIEITGELDAIGFQLAHARGRDNLDDVASVLTTRTRGSRVQASARVATLLRSERYATLLPTIALGWNRTHQFGAGIPTNADFQASHVPDQASVVRDYSAQWQFGRWRADYRHSRSTQDNRQEGREQSDFTARTNALSVGITARSNLDLGLDIATERQENLELKQVGRVRRAGLLGDWRVRANTTIGSAASISRAQDEPLTSDADNVELRLELAQRFDVRRRDGRADRRGQLFLRFARQSADMTTFGDPTFLPPPQSRAAWTLSSGLNFRLQ